MNEEEAYLEKESIINDVEDVVGSGFYSLEEITDEINDRLCHLTPE